MGESTTNTGAQGQPTGLPSGDYKPDALPSSPLAKRKNLFGKGNTAAVGRSKKHNPQVNTREIIASWSRAPVNRKKLHKILTMLANRALDNKDVAAAKEIMDRVYGKATEHVEVAGTGMAPTYNFIRLPDDCKPTVQLPPLEIPDSTEPTDNDGSSQS